MEKIIFLAFLFILLEMIGARAESSTDVLTRADSILNSTDLSGSMRRDSWKFPEQVGKDLPFYMMGYDYENRPVFVIELGRWEIQKYTDGSEESRKTLYRYAENMWSIIHTSKSPFEDVENGVTYIIDCQGLRLSQLLSKESTKYQEWNSRKMEMLESELENIFVINMNFAAQTWKNALRPLAGRWLGKAEIIGTDQARIKAALKSKISSNQLPPWYGGSQDFKPVLTSFHQRNI